LIYGSPQPGDLVARREDAWAEVLSVTDGSRLQVRYTGDGGTGLAGTEDTWDAGEVVSFSPAPPGPGWADKVPIIVHRIPESEASEEGYEAVTMMGVPENVSVAGHDPDSAEGALNHLMDGLRAFGFSGRFAVEDATHDGGMRRYEIQA
jgi:hypothetical protein